MPIRSTHSVTHAGARLALDAALQAAEEIGGRFNIAVTDPGGALVAFARMDGAFAYSADIAIDKARTVAGFGGIPSADLYAAIQSEEPVRFGIAKRSGVAAFGGGVPLLIDGELAGAIGASGGSAEQDTSVARAGAEALRAAVASTVNGRVASPH
ncbi:MAG: heme-binding protein [Actinomycetales bacterium]|nr:heme-binding protein [Actinomycetales bacterium]